MNGDNKGFAGFGGKDPVAIASDETAFEWHLLRMARPYLRLVCVGSKERECLADNIHCFELADSRKQHFRCGLTDDPEVVTYIVRRLASNLVGALTGTESAWAIRKWVLVRLFKGKNLSEKQRKFLHLNCEPRHFYPTENLTAYPSHNTIL